MRQLDALVTKIHVRNTTREYQRMSFQAKLAGGEMTTTLEQLLGVGSEESAFDEKQDQALDAYAKAQLEKMKSGTGRPPNKN